MSNNFMADTLATGGTSEEFLVVGQCDIWVSNLTGGSVKLQIKFPDESSFRDVPGESYAANIYKTIFISEHGVAVRLVGVGNSADTYVRLARFLNK